MNAVRGNSGGARDGERGFVLLALLALVGIGAVGVLFAVERLVPATAATVVATEQRLATVSRAARFAYRRNGAFPTDLTGLIAATDLDADRQWRIDPWASPTDLDYRTARTGATVRSRGLDTRLNTADDAIAVSPTEDLLRLRQRGRLRMIRAVLLRSAYCSSPTMPPADKAAMRTAMRDQARARRQWLTADGATRTTLATTLSASAATVASLRSTHSCPSMPTRLTGAGGLMERLGMPDGRAVDGAGRAFVRDAVLGVLATGADRTRGTDDDM